MEISLICLLALILTASEDTEVPIAKHRCTHGLLLPTPPTPSQNRVPIGSPVLVPEPLESYRFLSFSHTSHPICQQIQLDLLLKFTRTLTAAHHPSLPIWSKLPSLSSRLQHDGLALSICKLQFVLTGQSLHSVYQTPSLYWPESFNGFTPHPQCNQTPSPNRPTSSGPRSASTSAFTTPRPFPFPPVSAHWPQTERGLLFLGDLAFSSTWNTLPRVILWLSSLPRVSVQMDCYWEAFP